MIPLGQLAVKWKTLRNSPHTTLPIKGLFYVDSSVSFYLETMKKCNNVSKIRSKLKLKAFRLGADVLLTLREKCPDTKFFLVRIFLYLD